VIALADVLSVRLPDAAFVEGRGSGSSSPVPGKWQGVIDIECKSLSLSLVVSASIRDHVSRSIESARVHAMDMSELSKIQKAEQEESAPEVVTADMRGSGVVDNAVLVMMKGSGSANAVGAHVGGGVAGGAANLAVHSELAKLTQEQWRLSCAARTRCGSSAGTWSSRRATINAPSIKWWMVVAEWSYN
jgi:hypothetical protein